MNDIKVIKRDGKEESYDPEKIKKVVLAAGLDDKDADKLCAAITKWVRDLGIKSITSIRIRDQIVVEIQKFDEYASKKFIWWEKYKDKNFGPKP